MSADGRALLAAILANPDADGPRLMFADWLQEQTSDPHLVWLGEFIASQLAGVMHTGPVLTDTIVGHAALRVDGYGVYLHHTPHVFSGCLVHIGRNPDAARRNPVGFHVNRGFVSHVESSCWEFTKYEGMAGPLFARHPVSAVRLMDRYPLEVRLDGTGVSDFSWMNAGMTQFARLLNNLHDPWKLPEDLFNLIDGHDAARNDELGEGLGVDRVRIFHDADSATEALRRACLLYGKKAAADWLVFNSP